LLWDGGEGRVRGSEGWLGSGGGAGKEGGGVEFHSMQMKGEPPSFPDVALELEGKHRGQGAVGHLVAVGREGADQHRLTVPCDRTSEDYFTKNDEKTMKQRSPILFAGQNTGTRSLLGHF